MLDLISRTAFVVEPTRSLGYYVTVTQYVAGGIAPARSEWFGPLSLGELSELVESVLDTQRPGLRLDEGVAQFEFGVDD
jgi:hypothetical protein